MLKRTEPPREPQEERPVGELVHQLVEDGKAYAKAELEVAKTLATSKARALAVPAALFSVSALVAQSAVTVLAVAVFYALSLVMNVILAGLLAFLLFAAIAGGLGWYAVKRVKRDL